MTMIIDFGDKYSIAPHSVMNDTRLSANDKMVMIAILCATTTEDRKHATISMKNIMHYSSLSESAVRRSIKHLKELHYITGQNQRFESNGREKAPEYEVDTHHEVEVSSKVYWGEKAYYAMTEKGQTCDTVYVDFTGKEMVFKVAKEEAHKVEEEPKPVTGRRAMAKDLIKNTVRGFPKEETRDDGVETVTLPTKKTLKRVGYQSDTVKPTEEQPREQYRRQSRDVPSFSGREKRRATATTGEWHDCPVHHGEEGAIVTEEGGYRTAINVKL